MQTLVPNFPSSVTYSNAIGVYDENSAASEDHLIFYALPSVHPDIEIRLLAPDHPAYRKPGCCGIFATRDISDENTYIGSYAGIARCLTYTQFDRYICNGFDDEVEYDAYRFGNETRLVNDCTGIADCENVKLAVEELLEGAPEGICHLLIKTTRAIKAGDELVLDYGKAYWSSIENNERDPFYKPNFYAMLEVGDVVKMRNKDNVHAIITDTSQFTMGDPGRQSFEVLVGGERERRVVAPCEITKMCMLKGLADKDVRVGVSVSVDGRRSAIIMCKMSAQRKCEVVFEETSERTIECAIVDWSRIKLT